MCVLVLSWQHSSDHPVLLFGNRDEFYARPASSLSVWRGMEHVVGGRDLEHGGGWLASSFSGRWGAITNVRKGYVDQEEKHSRGLLLGLVLNSDERLGVINQQLLTECSKYRPFNFIFGDRREAYYLTNEGEGSQKIQHPGVYGLSNGDLDEAWPKVTKVKRALSALDLGQTTEVIWREGLRFMLDRSVAAPEELPDTGVGAALESFLSPIFISGGESYGTRVTTMLALTRDTSIIRELRYDSKGKAVGESSYVW